MPTPGSLTSLMTGLVAAQAAVPDHPLLADLEPLSCYRWRPDAPDAPALWNWLDDSTSGQMDTMRRRDSYIISTKIGIAPMDDDDRMAALEVYTDAYRAVVDPLYRNEVRTPPALGGTVKWAERSAMRMFAEEFGGVTLIGIAFVQRFDVDRAV